MTKVDINFEEYIEKRSITEKIFTFIIVGIFSYMMTIFINLLIIMTYPSITILEQYPMVKYIIPSLITIMTLFRYHIMRYILKHFDWGLIYAYFKNLSIVNIILMINFGILIYINSLKNIFPVTVEGFIFICLLLQQIIYFTFYNSLTDKYCITFIFIKYREYDKNIIKQNFWIKKIVDELVHYFSIIGIFMSKEDIIYKINIKKLNGDSINLDKLEEWMISDNKNNKLLDNIKEIIPDIEIKKQESTPWYDKIKNIPIEHIKYFTLILFVILYIVLEGKIPTSITDIIS